MNDKCKYCSYVSKCSERCEYNSILCLLNRRIPKIVNKSYEELKKENEELKKQNKKYKEVIDHAYIRTQHLLDYYDHYKVLPKTIIDELINLQSELDILREVK